MSARRLVEIVAALRDAVEGGRYGAPVTHVYNPLVYAWRAHECYLRRYGKGRKQVLLLGMNPGPFGMVQTGVPFGEVAAVRDWLGIEAEIDRPPSEHPRRPVLGFDCPRSEVSGRRLWGWARTRFGSPDRFFARFFVHNFCPLVFMEESGRNVTPDKLRAGERGALFAACDRALLDVVGALRPDLVVGVGAFAARRAKAVLEGSRVHVGTMPHPSPASPLANRGWEPLADAALESLGVDVD